ncbi:Nif3-like dinuclear metal center hexameric protein [Spelaeicoccus albus]|uniref:GTP cyclohydrolase 1 type 2 homolog n=1 Tax=Spelaeicoccus albus TaxID=1280376 RepID=A0A7Z0D3V2_9MICO|nr:Nif3-like dinuclear metal center hexameric protein [Spelaeicoccus albus]NYI68311.1 dinuclear metal center YbgI/SA1388 family protein [Spelaeicoccus albus]
MDSPSRPARIDDIVGVMENAWPQDSAEEWDVVGLTVGDPRLEITRVLFAVDPTMAVAREAERAGAQLIVTHHPLLMRGVHAVDAGDAKGAVIHRLIQGGIALINAHTNADIAPDGVSQTLIEALGVKESRPLNAPEPRPCASSGPGRVGDLAREESLNQFAQRVAAALPATAGGVRVAGPPDGRVRRVAVCGGAGDGYFDLVRASGADVYVTSDLRHHPASEARETALAGRGTPYLVDVSHWAGESLWTAQAARTVVDGLRARGITVEATVSVTNTDPWTFQLPSGE